MAATNLYCPVLAVTAVLLATSKKAPSRQHGCPRSSPSSLPAAVTDAHPATTRESSLSIATLAENLLGNAMLVLRECRRRRTTLIAGRIIDAVNLPTVMAATQVSKESRISSNSTKRKRFNAHAVARSATILNIVLMLVMIVAHFASFRVVAWRSGCAASAAVVARKKRSKASREAATAILAR